MKKLMLSLALLAACGVAGQAGAADFAPQQGQLYSKAFGGVKVHDYVTKTGAAAQVVETDKLVVFDVPGTAPQNADFKAFVQSLGKPVEAVIVTHKDDHHWAGIETLFPGVKLYSLDADAIKSGGKAALAQSQKRMGAEMMPYATVPALEKLTDGVRTFGGVEYLFTALPELQAVIIRMPAQKVAMVHHLGYVGVHVPMPPFEQRLAQLQALEKTGYTWIVAGHGTPGDSKEFIKAVADYYAFVTDAVKKSKKAEDAKALIVKQYPNYQSMFLLDMLLPGMMGK